MELLIDYGADLFAEQVVDDQSDPHRYMPALLVNAMFGVPDTIPLLEKAGANIRHLSINGENLLDFAARYGNESMIEFLLERGFDANDMGDYHSPALFAAVQGGHLGAVIRLIDAGANVNHVDVCGGTALDYAGEGTEIDKLLIDNGAKKSPSTA